MKGTEKARETQDRYIALDIHKEYVLAGDKCHAGMDDAAATDQHGNIL